jgi:Zn-finger in Ran binding protein and others
VTDEGITWDCSRCGTINPLESNLCDVCGATFAVTILPRPPVRPARDPGTAALLSLFCPGAGHAYLGLWPQAVARGIVSMWVIATIFLTASGAGAGSGVIAGVFAAAGFAFWIVAAHDALREATLDEDAVLLKGRTFLYVVLALLLLLMGSLVLSGLRSGVALP